jgi:hypothetical protein
MLKHNRLFDNRTFSAVSQTGFFLSAAKLLSSCCSADRRMKVKGGEIREDKQSAE